MTFPTPDASTGAALRRAPLAVVMLAAMATPAVPLQSSQAASAPPTGSDAATPTVGRALVGTHRITLITGDVVVLQVTADGRQAAWVADPVDTRAPAQVYEVDGEVHVVPAEAAPYVASGAVDDNLFDITLLARDGFDDAATDELPLLVEASDRARASAMPAAPEGTEEVRELDSVNTVSVTADKADARTAWKALTGSSPASTTSTDAQLAGDKTVWLNGRVEATLDESVSQIGAPEAWAAGFDGSGTTVAVLDSGYDPTHPDLADRVVDAENFTDIGDPTDAVDDNGHGTHVAATIGGSGAASDGDRKGVAPGTDLIIGKVLDANGVGFDDQIIAGMEWAVDHGADVVNMSIGTPFPSDGTDPMSEAVNRLTRQSGALFVVAAGNSGPGEQTVGSPGAADLALTVGAVDKDDQPAAFSSRGPRFGDGAIKPEITAPGVDIVAARAAGTSLGNLLDEYYTSLSGTSMATPHVAGAAAILAQEHPDWSAAQLKSRLISTSKALDAEPVTFQGAGRVDVATAIGDSVQVDDAVLSLGRIPVTSAPVTRALTYTNASDHVVKLRMSADVTSTGSDEKERPDLTFSRDVLAVPAGGQATVQIRLAPGRTESGSYAGQIVAHQVGGHAAVHSVTSFSVDGPLRTVTVNALDRAGKPASGPVDLWSAETGEWTRAFLDQGSTTFQVPDGLYSLVATIESAGLWFESTVHTVAGDPQLRVSRDLTLHYDARQASPVRVETPRDADLADFRLTWNRSVGRRSLTMETNAQGGDGEQVFALKSPRAQTGSFTLASQWQLNQPLLTAQVSGPDGFRLASPVLVSPGFGGICQCPPQVFVGERTLPLVDAGVGTPESFGAVDAEGAVALVSRSDQLDALRSQAEAAADAGAALLLAYNTSTDPFIEQVVNAPLPIYLVDRETGGALLEALNDDPRLRLELAGVSDSTYQYDLAFAERRGIPDGRTYDADPKSLATVTSDYRQNSDQANRTESWIPYLDGVGVANSMATPRNGPVVRTDYVNTDGVQWQRFAQQGSFGGFYFTTTPPRQYAAGQRDHQVWWGPLVHPAVPPAAAGTSSAPLLGTAYRPVARFRDAIRINLPHYSYGGSLAGTIQEQFGDRSTVTLAHDGEVLGTSTWPDVQFTVPADKAWYDLSLDVVNGDDHWSDTSVSTSTTWRFASARTDESGAVLPLVQVHYGLETNGFNEVPAGSSYALTLDPGYQPEADGPGRFTGHVEVSFDDGTTWQSAPVDRGGGRLRAQVPAATGPGFASVRVDVTDADGNELIQRIDRAWKIGAPLSPTEPKIG